MLEPITHDDVTELRFTSLRSRSIRYGVSAFFSVSRGVLIDTGFPDVGRELERWVNSARPRGVIITHGHEDHSGNVPRLVAAGLPVQMAEDSEAIVRNPGKIGWYRRYCWGVPAPLRAPVESFAHPAFALRPARGHSADHHVVWDEERATVFGGDLFIGVKVRLAHHDEDLRGQVVALREVASWNPERFFCGHRGLLPDPVTALRTKADWIEQTIGEIEERVQAGWGDVAIRNHVLGREDLTGIASFGDYSRLNFVQSIRRSLPAGSTNPPRSE